MLGELTIILLLIVANGFFSGAEIAVISLRKTRIHELLQAPSKRAAAVKALRDNPERFLATVQIGITVVGATAAAFGGATVAARLRPLLEPIAGGHAEQLALTLVVIAVSYLTLIFGELVPKSLALRSAETYALLVARPMLWLAGVSRPLVWLLTASSNAVLRLFGDRTSFTEARLSPDELQQLVDEAGKAGSIHPRASEIASRALAFGALTAADVMAPRQKIAGLSKDASTQEIRRVLLEEGHSRMPVFDGSIDNIVGYIVVLDVLAVAWESNLIILQDVLRTPYFVPETMPAVDLLHELQRRRMELAIVVDERGGTAGLVTTEDLIEELVGELFSERDEVTPDVIRKEPDGTYLVQGATPIRDVNRALQLELPEGEGYSTMAGLAITLAGQIPPKGARIAVNAGLVLDVVESSSRRIWVIRIRPLPASGDA